MLLASLHASRLAVGRRDLLQGPVRAIVRAVAWCQLGPVISERKGWGEFSCRPMHVAARPRVARTWGPPTGSMPGCVGVGWVRFICPEPLAICDSECASLLALSI